MYLCQIKQISMKKKSTKNEIPKKIEFETYRDLTSHFSLSGLKQQEPSAINFLAYRKYKVTIELIEEPKEVLLERLNKLLNESQGHNSRSRIQDEMGELLCD